MNLVKAYILLICITGFHYTVLYAANTIIQNITGWQESDRDGSYGNRMMTINNGDLKFVNKDGDSNVTGDYFSGYYYDPAFGVFRTDANVTDRVRISNTSISGCWVAFDGYRLEGFSYNQNFGFVDFNFDATNYSFICLPTDETDDSLDAYLWGVAYSPYIWFQSLSGINFDSSVDVDPDGTENDDNTEGRFIKVDGIVASEKNTELLVDQFEGEVRILWELTKSTFRRDIHQKVYPLISNLETGILPDPYAIPAIHLWKNDWSDVPEGAKLLNNAGLYFKDTEIRLGWQNNIQGEKTLVVEGADVYITGNIQNSDDDGILGIIVLQKDGVGWNIYIDPTVTDIHAVMYADRSLISYNGTTELDGSTPASSLANQLFIQGSVFSENTIGSSQDTPAVCPYYVASADCNTQNKAMKYDLNFLRKYILVQPIDADGNPVGDKVPQNLGIESFMWDSSRDNTDTQKSGYRKYPVIIEYDSKIQSSPPPFFSS